MLTATHTVAMKVGRPAMRAVASQARGHGGHVISDCPLAAEHLFQGAREIAVNNGTELPARKSEHPIEVFAHAYRLM